MSATDEQIGIVEVAMQRKKDVPLTLKMDFRTIGLVKSEGTK